MQWLIAIIALLSGSAVGALIIRRILLKQHAINDGELSQLRMKNVEIIEFIFEFFKVEIEGWKSFPYGSPSLA